jgi:hypothetical protein
MVSYQLDIILGGIYEAIILGNAVQYVPIN